jgi:hypothetical protein
MTARQMNGSEVNPTYPAIFTTPKTKSATPTMAIATSIKILLSISVFNL